MTTAIQVVQLLVSLVSILITVRAYRAAHLDAEHLSISPEAAYDGSDIAAAGNIQRERLLLLVHITLFVLVGILSLLIPLEMTEYRILVVRTGCIIASLFLLRISLTAWKRRQQIIERIRARRREGHK